MFSFELGAFLSSQWHSRLPIEVVLRGGHNCHLTIRSVGVDWFSALQSGGLSREFVITFDAVTFVRGAMSGGQQDFAPRSKVPLVAMLVQLERQHTLLCLHLRDINIVGYLTRVGRDCIGVQGGGAGNLLVPLSQLLWMEACG